MTDPRTPDEGALRPPADTPPAAAPQVDIPQVDIPQVDSFAAEPAAEPARPRVSLDKPAPAAPVEAPPVPLDEPATPAPEEVPAERTLADEDPAAPEPGSSDPVVLPPPPGTDGGADGTPAARGSRAWVPLAVIGTVVALLVAGTGYLGWQLRQQSRAEQARQEATAAARDAARLLFSYDHETLEQDFEKGLSVTTGGFRDQYRRTTVDVVTPVAEQYDAVVVAEVIEAAIVQASANRVTALVFLNQGTTSTRVQGQQVDQSRVRMQLVRTGGRWLVEGVGAL